MLYTLPVNRLPPAFSGLLLRPQRLGSDLHQSQSFILTEINVESKARKCDFAIDIFIFKSFFTLTKCVNQLIAKLSTVEAAVAAAPKPPHPR
ncbi:hypothetical protein JOB18_003885 [Solea senegalensis]|uniref:Uncharacterized protein n=1 Tax=Solea senegalensis TaxID=28829 RepID=A0AAV6PJP7_SOLSE|nr:hypothetical protein JOB18_003885 [Solea senegalensis]